MTKNHDRSGVVAGAAAWRVRTGGPSDYHAIPSLLHAVYGTIKPPENIQWLYEDNPSGRCLLWLAEDEATRQVVSVNPMFPWRVRVGGTNFLSVQPGDAATAPEFQGRGIWGDLVETAWRELQAQGMTFTFSFPNPGALSVFKKVTPRVGVGRRAGSYDILHFQRLTYPLSVTMLARRLPAGRALAGLLDPLYGLYLSSRLAVPTSVTVFPIARFDDEADTLWAEASRNHGALVVRDSLHLNWRFLAAPGRVFQALGIRQGGRLAGYVIWERDAEGDVWVVDLLCVASPDIFRTLLRAVLLTGRQLGAARVSTWMAQENPLFATARALGFIARKELLAMAVHVLVDGPETDLLLDPTRWWAWLGDRDI